MKWKDLKKKLRYDKWINEPPKPKPEPEYDPNVHHHDWIKSGFGLVRYHDNSFRAVDVCSDPDCALLRSVTAARFPKGN
jgi:hypothetical protein